MKLPTFSYRKAQRELLSHRAALVALFLLIFATNAFAFDPAWPSTIGITFEAKQNLNAGYPIDLNSDVWDWQKVIENGDLRLDLGDLRVAYNDFELNHFVEDDNSLDVNRIWFELPINLSSGTPIDFNFYFNNPVAVHVPAGDLNSPAVDNNMVFYYRMEDNADNNTILDYSGNNNDANISKWSSLQSTQGKNRNAIGEFLDDSFFIDTGIVLDGQVEGTIDLFVNVEAMPGQYLFGANLTGGGAESFHGYIDGDGDVIFNRTNGWSIGNGAATITTTGWWHVSMSWGPAGAQICINGVEKASSGDTSDVGTTLDTLFIGAHHENSAASAPLDGVIDEFRLRDVQLDCSSFYKPYPAIDLQGSIIVTDTTIKGLSANFSSTQKQTVNAAGKTVMSIDLNNFTEAISVSNLVYAWHVGSALAGTDINLTYIAPYAGTYEVGLAVTGTDDFATKYYSDFNESITVTAGTLSMQFYDENTFAAVDPTVTVNGVGQSTTGGLLSFDMNNLGTGGITVVASSVVYGSRTWLFEDFNQFSSVDKNAAILKLTEGASTDFKFYKQDQSTLFASQKIEVLLHDNNLAGIQKTDSSGEVSFFLDGSTDVNKYIFKLFDSNGSIYHYYPVDTNFFIPKDESTGAAVSPYNLDTSPFDFRSFSGATTDLNFWILPNTVNTYQFDVNGGSNYLTRKLEVNYKGDPRFASIQAYLPPIQAGLSAVFYTRNAVDNSVVPGITIKAFRNIVGEGRVEVQSVITDAAGTATMSFTIDDIYEFEVYDTDDVLVDTFSLRPNFTEYYIYLDLDAIIWEESTQEYIIISGLPNVGYVSVTTGQGYDVNVTVDVNYGTLATSWLTVVGHQAGGDVNFTFNDNCGSGCGFTIGDVNMTNSFSVTVKVFVKTASGLKLEKEWNFIPSDASSYNLVAILQGAAFKREWGCSANPNESCFFLLIVSLFISLIVMVAAGSVVTTDFTSLGIVGVIMIGIFTYLTWIPVGLFILACLAVFGAVVVSRRGG